VFFFNLPRSFVCKLWGLSIHLVGAVSMTFAVDTSSCLEFAFCVPTTPRMYNANIWVPEKERGVRHSHILSVCLSVSVEVLKMCGASEILITVIVSQIQLPQVQSSL
jgi:hypothetical protein